LATQEFLIDLFKSPDPFAPADVERGRTITVVDALEIGQVRARTELVDQPELRASLLAAISEVYASLEVSQAAVDLREEVLQLEREIYGGRSQQVVASMRAFLVQLILNWVFQRLPSASKVCSPVMSKGEWLYCSPALRNYVLRRANMPER